jgi:hypothetical protein
MSFSTTRIVRPEPYCGNVAGRIRRRSVPRRGGRWLPARKVDQMKIVESPSRYRNASDMREAGYEGVADLIESAGLPLEILHIIHDRVLRIISWDYEEGQEKPLTERSTWWFDVLGQPHVEPCSVMGALIAVHPDGSRHTWIDGSRKG